MDSRFSAVLLLVVFAGGFVAGHLFVPRTVIRIVPQTVTRTEYRVVSASDLESSAVIKVPAVDDVGKGVVTLVDVHTKPGSGRTLANIDKIFFFVDTQSSINTARFVAENMTGINLSLYDIIYTITANASVIEGPSAGAALTITTIAALQNKTINSSVMITGTINLDGTIGMVGQVGEKAKAAKAANATLFLVPAGSRLQNTSYEKQQRCETRGEIEYCTIEYVEKKGGDEKFGLRIREVATIEEAAKYFII